MAETTIGPLANNITGIPQGAEAIDLAAVRSKVPMFDQLEPMPSSEQPHSSLLGALFAHDAASKMGKLSASP